ncbi:VIT domain-containing protein [Kamptonema cortianum]|nr:VIT domain-containing protein [Geitlerinema splendidum]MDK3157592.1 VIT domain-containing protein [Kamptonema cortianum]
MKNLFLGMIAAFVALPVVGLGQAAEPGQLTCIRPDGTPGQLVPLKNTKVFADIAGMSARVTVIQTFANTSETPIEAVYVFPLPHDAAVDRMNMRIGNRLIEGEIHRRADALQIYTNAKNQGMMAALLDQERPNIFTQSVANIVPGAEVQIEISYIQMIQFEDGEFEWNFPMVVGPRYMAAGTPDPGRIEPAFTPPGTRTGTNISIEAVIDMGTPMAIVRSPLHLIRVNRAAEGSRMYVQLAKRDEIPNKDFILNFATQSASIKSTVLSHKLPNESGSFCLTFIPPDSDESAYVAPRELVIVMDQSGSQSGLPIQKSKEVSVKVIQSLRQHDLFNVIAFSNGAKSLWPESVPVTESNVRQAISWVNSLEANGGTEFLPAIQLALDSLPPRGMPRIVAFNTDGYIGNDVAIIQEIRKRREVSRMFTFGIGNSVNRFLIDVMAAESRGDSEIVTLDSSADEAVERFVRRIESPILTDIKVSFQGIDVHELTPQLIPDVFSSKPVTVFGRYSRGGSGQITISGTLRGRAWSETMQISFPNVGESGSGVSTMWARNRIGDLQREDWFAQSQGRSAENTNAIIQLALKHRLVTDHTSFVAVEKRIVNVGGKQRTVHVPVDRVDGVSDLAYGDARGFARSAPATKSALGAAGGGGFGGAAGGGTSGITTATDRSEQSGAASPTSKIHRSLEKKTGQLEVQIRVSEIDEEILAELKRLGFRLEDRDEDNKILFGTLDAKALSKIAENKKVLAILPL